MSIHIPNSEGFSVRPAEHGGFYVLGGSNSYIREGCYIPKYAGSLDDCVAYIRRELTDAITVQTLNQHPIRVVPSSKE